MRAVWLAATVFLLVSTIIAGFAGCDLSSGLKGNPTSTTHPASTSTPVPPLPATISLDAGPLATAIPANFVGFSIEPQYLCRFLAIEQTNPALDQFYRTLGPSIIRFGGNSMDNSIWNPDATCSQLTFGVSTIADIFAFARRVDAQIIWGLNLKANNPTAAADEAATVAALGGDRLLGFEIGNEPNTWTTAAAYLRMWDAYASAIAAAAPGALLTGPAMYDNQGRNWFGQFVSSRHSSLARVTYHFYPLQSDDPAGSPMGPTIDNLLSPQLMARTSADVRRVVRQAGAYGLPLEIDETNSINGGGVMGVSNVFAAALWGADYLFTSAEQGVSSVNMHSNGGILTGDSYAPIAMDADSGMFYARPLYYGMLLFHLAASDGAVPLPTTVSSRANLAAHALLNADGRLVIALINKDASSDVRAHVVLGSYSQSVKDGRAIRLTAPSRASIMDVTLAGNSVDAYGAWAPRVSEHVGIKNASFTIVVPHGSAVLVTLTA
jgi:hypothetical protein